MIIDRIFSLVNKRSLESKWGNKVSTAIQIQHPKFTFERQDDGGFIVESVAESKSKLQHYFYEIQIRQIKGRYMLVAKLNRYPIIYADIFLSLAFAYLLFVSIAVLNPFILVIYFVLLGVITLMQAVICHFIIDDIEYALFKATFNPK